MDTRQGVHPFFYTTALGQLGSGGPAEREPGCHLHGDLCQVRGADGGSHSRALEALGLWGEVGAHSRVWEQQ